MATNHVERCTKSKRGPSTAWLALTEACNNKCTWCYENENSYLDNGRSGAVAQHLTIPELQIAIPTLIACGLTRVILIGGEPSLNPDILKIISYIKSLGLDLTMVTNGRSASKLEIAQSYASAGLAEATVSLHGWSEDSYEGRGGAVNFAQSMHGYVNLRRVGIRAGANMVLGSHTVGHEVDIVKFLAAHGISQVQFNTAAPAVSPSGVDASFTVPPKVMASHALDLYRLCTAEGIFASFQMNLPFCLFEPSDLDVMLAVGAIKQSCHVIHGGGIVIRPGLRTAVCTHLMEFVVNDSNEANVFSSPDGFLQFWRSQELEQERKDANAYRRPQCVNCPKWDECGGGCMVHWSFYDPVTFEPAIRRGRPVSIRVVAA